MYHDCDVKNQNIEICMASTKRRTMGEVYFPVYIFKNNWHDPTELIFRITHDKDFVA